MSNLYVAIKDDQLPIVYDKRYNISFWGFEKLHLFDAKKWCNVVKLLKEYKLVTDESLVLPKEVTKEDLLVVHTKKYLNKLKWSFNVACITEVPPIAFVPNCFIQNCYLRPMRLQTGGSILAGRLALQRGWAMNIGGGFHHCCSEQGGGFCPYADITLLVRFLQINKLIQRAMIVDLDAHQGNGYERDFVSTKDVYILDMYNKHIYPKDKYAKTAITKKIELNIGTRDLEYLTKLKKHLPLAMDAFTPDIVVYNAGTDVFESDPLGLLNITSWGIIERDEFVFKSCRQRGIPIVMLTSGGYRRETAKIIADSIFNLHTKGIIDKTAPLTSDQITFQSSQPVTF